MRAGVGQHALARPTSCEELLDGNRRARSRETLGYEQLYNLLTSQAKERLGLIKGFKMVLDVEKCANEAELRTLAVKFVGLVKEAQGEPAAKTMRLALGMAG